MLAAVAIRATAETAGPATSAELAGPQSVALDAAGDLFIADTGNNVIREVTTDGNIATVAGNGTAGYSGDGGVADAAEFNGPSGVSLDAAGDLLIADSTNSVIREVAASVPVTVTPPVADHFTLTGLLANAPSGTQETFTVTALGVNGGLASGYSGTVHFTSNDPNAILPANATLTNGVGTFTVTFETVGTESLTATDTETGSITGSDSEIGVSGQTKVTLTTSASTLTTVDSLTLTATVTGLPGQPTPDGGTVTFYDGTTAIGMANLVEGSASYAINRAGLGPHSYSAIYSGVTGAYASGIVGLTGQNTIVKVAGTGTQGSTGNGGQANSAELDLPSGIVFDAAGDLFIADPGAHVVREVTPAGIISTYAGTGSAGYTGDGGQATAARLYAPYGLAIDAAGDLFIADDGNNTVRMITPAGIITTVAGNGTGGSTGTGGQATSAELDEPTGVAVDASGNLYIADSYNNEIREVTTDGVIHDFAGTGTTGDTGDGGQATSAEIHDPSMVAVYGGNVYFTDFGNSKVREVTTDGVIHDVAGTGTGGDTGDGGQATSAEIDGPIGLAFNSVGDMFISDYDDSTVREVTTDGVIQTVAGSHDAFEYGSSNGNNGPGSSAGFYYLQGLAVDANGDLFIADNYNAQIREMVSSVNVNVSQASATHFVVTGIPGSVTAGTPETLTVTAEDADGNTVTAYAGTVDLTSSDGQAVLPSGSTLTNGVGTFDVTLKTAATESVTATDSGNSGITGSESGIVVSPGSAANLVVVGGIDEIAGGIEVVTVTAYDAYGNVATGYAGMAAITSSDGQAVLPPDSTLTNGVGSFDVTLETAGSDSITVTDAGNPQLTATDSGIIVTPATATHFSVTSSPTIATAGVAETVTVTALDAFGNTVIGYSGTVDVTSTNDEAMLPPGSTLTNGVGTFQVTLDDSGTGPSSITATDSGNSGITGTESGIVVQAASATSLFVTHTHGMTEFAGEVEIVTVTAYDFFGNVATGYAGTVAISSTDGQAVLPPDSTLTNGVGSFDVTLETAGIQSITATDAGNPDLTATDSGIAVAAGSATHFAIAPVVGTPNAYTVTAMDAYGNPATSYAGTVGLTSDDPAAKLPADAALANGLGTFRVILETLGTHSITATDAGNPDVTGTQGGIATLTTSGLVYDDLNAGGTYQTGESGLAGRVVFLDLNGDGTLDPGDPTATTNAQGQFTLGGGLAGEFPVLEATGQDGATRYVVDQTSTGDTVSIGVVPISPVAPVAVVPSPFSTTRSGDPNTAFVQSLYRAVLGRDGEPGGIDSWVARMNSGLTRGGVAADFINSTEHRQDEVTAYYEEFLHRAPDPGSSLWVDDLTSGVSEEKVVESILNSPEYQAAHADQTTFIDDLYIDVLGRQADAPGEASWQTALTSGTSRQTVIADFVQSAEAVDQLVTSDYTAYLHRQPESGTSGLWATMLESPNGSATDVAIGILASEEFDDDATAG